MHYLEGLLVKLLLNVEKTDNSAVYQLHDCHNLDHLEHMVANLKVILALHFSVFELEPDRMDFLRLHPCLIARFEISQTHFKLFVSNVILFNFN